MQHAREMNTKSIHCIFLAPFAGTGVGGEQRKGSRDSKPTPLSADVGTIFKDRMAFALPPFQNLELKVSKASSSYHAMLLGDKEASTYLLFLTTFEVTYLALPQNTVRLLKSSHEAQPKYHRKSPPAETISIYILKKKKKNKHKRASLPSPS